ncbi:hypothetical protein PACTADRAFT_46791 [Pachysolen tannophilus NRRL Y-2460]|uniref:Peptidase S8/S53 domain-containing protein n=1 Tax=Pachysolen tannophilus NRRL Y-2460 TaxID=669874 RepID=A0A1E4TP09_PACTA|nr:hypothetical protein PACTADRAFT_46791 [Pachysolen tannophilus NRRL Y-2460]
MKLSFVFFIFSFTVLSYSLTIPTLYRNDDTDLLINKDSAHKFFFNKFNKIDKVAPIYSSELKGREIIPNSYIVVFKKTLDQERLRFHKNQVLERQLIEIDILEKKDPGNEFIAQVKGSGDLLKEFKIGDLVHGYSGIFLPQTLEFIRHDPLIAFVEKDSKVYANEFAIEKDSPWGLARISSRKSLDYADTYDYLYDDEGGKGVTAYVIDTGIYIEHNQFEGRAKWGKTIPAGNQDKDDHGHGTHCAGTIASKDYGIAKNAEVVAVKVLSSDGSGSMSDVIKGVEFVANAHTKAVKEGKKGFKGSTANMSLGGGNSPALDMAVNAAVKAGIHFGVAAGNENDDACYSSPASAELAITVGASSVYDYRAYFSNYGKCVDVFAPGLNILSTYIGYPEATTSMSGTSMASPHIVGLLTYFLSLHPDSDSEFFASGGVVTPAQLKKQVLAFATKDTLASVPEDTPNLLIFNGAGQDLSPFWGNITDSNTDEQVQVHKDMN